MSSFGNRTQIHKDFKVWMISGRPRFATPLPIESPRYWVASFLFCFITDWGVVVLGWGWKKGYLYIDILTQCSTLILIFDRPLFIARSSSVADNTWDIMSILFYESRKQNDNSTMNFNDQLLSCSFFLLPYRVGYSNGILQIDGGSSSANGAKTSSGSSQILRVSPQTLVYLELSPDFCRANITAGMFRFPNLIQMPFLRCVHIYKLEIFFFFRNKRNER